MKAIILAAGEGTRLRPYTLERPKCMVEANGISLLDLHLMVLRYEGVNDITLIGGYRSNKLPSFGIKLRQNPRYSETNMVWTLFCAEDQLNSEDDVIVAYGDIVYSHKILKQLVRSNSDISIAIDLNWKSYWDARSDAPLDDLETLRMDEIGRIIEIGQKPKTFDEIEGQYMGLIKLSKVGQESFRKIFHKGVKSGSIRGKDPEKAYMTDLLQMMIDEGIAIHSVGIKDNWVEVDTVDDLISNETRNRLRKISTELDF